MLVSGFTRQELKEQLSKLIYGGSINMVTQGLKPTWQGLKGSGASKTPVEEVVGQCIGWKMEQDNFQNNNVILQFNQCQILKSDTPFPYAEWELAIKYSDTANSAWGIFGLSAALSLGIDIELLDIDLLKGRWIHLLRTPHIYGPDRSKPEEQQPDGSMARPNIIGQVWRIVELVAPGQQVTTMATTLPAIVPNGLQPLVSGMPLVTPPMVAPPTTPGIVLPIPASTAPAVVLTSEQQALILLNGKDAASFFQAAIPDPIIKADPVMVNAILSNSFVAAKIAAGQVVKNDDGTHTVIPATPF